MEGQPKNIHGDVMPVMRPVTSGSQQINGTIAHAESTELDEGVYRCAVKTSVDDLGVMLKIVNDTTTATTVTGLWMGQGSVEYFFIPQGYHITVIDGLLNLTKVV